MDLFDLLLNYGVDVNLADGTPIHPSWSDSWGGFHGHNQMISGSPLFVAVKSCHTEVVTRLLELGALPNENSCSIEECSHVVHAAAAHRDPTILKDLLKYGANPTANCYICPSALMTAVRAQNLDTISILIKAGANVNAPDLFSRTPLARAKDGCLELATKTLLEYQAEESIPLEKVRSCLEDAVKTLASRLLQGPDPWGNDGYFGNFLNKLWISLGRCLILGKDNQNGVIALEQIILFIPVTKRLPEWQIQPRWHLRPTCCYCGDYESGKFQLCEDCDGGVFCENCIERHLILIRKSTYSHSVTKFPRELLWGVPEGQIALDESTYLPVRVWLEGLRGWTAKL
jgi:ankyrin repeat protein